MTKTARSTLAIAALAASLGFGAMLAPPAHALTWASRDFTCPLDGEKFTARVPASWTKFGTRLDLRPIGALVAPYPVPVCPTTGFPIYKKKFSAQEIAKLKTIVASPAYREARKKNTSYYLVGFLRERMGDSASVTAYAYLQASWQAETKDPALNRRYLTLTLDRLDRAIAKAKPKSRGWWTMQVLAANLTRRLGRFADAEKRLERLPLDELAAKSVYRRLVTQVRGLAAKRDVAPRRFGKS